jgi:hypothetical protein
MEPNKTPPTATVIFPTLKKTPTEESLGRRFFHRFTVHFSSLSLEGKLWTYGNLAEQCGQGKRIQSWQRVLSR